MRKRKRKCSHKLCLNLVCMHAGQPPCSPGVTGQWRISFLWWLLSCRRCLFSALMRETCKTGTLVLADKCMSLFSVVPLTLGFSIDLVWSRQPALSAVKPCVVRVSSNYGEVSLSINDTSFIKAFFLAAINIYFCLVRMNVRFNLIHHIDIYALKSVALYELCSVYCVMHNHWSIN